MNCNETRRLLEADLDGELDSARHLEVQAHLRSCADCTQVADGLRARREKLKTSLPRFTAPTSLAQKIRSEIRAEPVPFVPAAPTRGEGTPPTIFRAAPRIWPSWTWGALAASLAVAVFVGYETGGARARGNLLMDEAISDHVRSLQTGHLTDVVSTDQHTVKPWFTGKLDFSPPVVDLASAGFPLSGGRLEYLDGRPAAALVFHRRQHPINVFVWPSRGENSSTRHGERAGYAAEFWSQGDLNFLAVSEIPASELTEFIAAFRAASR